MGAMSRLKVGVSADVNIAKARELRNEKVSDLEDMLGILNAERRSRRLRGDLGSS